MQNYGKIPDFFRRYRAKIIPLPPKTVAPEFFPEKPWEKNQRFNGFRGLKFTLMVSSWQLLVLRALQGALYDRLEATRPGPGTGCNSLTLRVPPQP